jgi:hypothetical protein
MFSLVETFQHMCQVKREHGDKESEPIIQEIQMVLRELSKELPGRIKNGNFDSRSDLVKALEEIKKYLDEKYKKTLIDKKFMQATFETQLLDEYKAGSRIEVRTLTGGAAPLG